MAGAGSLVAPLGASGGLRDPSGGLWLVGTGGAAVGRCVGLSPSTHDSAETSLKVGRSPVCHLPLDDMEVSGQHVVLWWDAALGHAAVADRPGSFNGTYLRLSSEREVSAAYPLMFGDTLVVGDHALTLAESSAEPSAGEEVAEGAGQQHEGAGQAAASGGAAPSDPEQVATMRSSPSRGAAPGILDSGVLGGDANGDPNSTLKPRGGAVEEGAGSNGGGPRVRPRSGAACLRVSKHRGGGELSQLDLAAEDGRTVTIGRAKSNAVALVTDQSVSANHAELSFSSELLSAQSGCSGWSVRDLGSSSGTAIRLSAERVASRSFPLTPGHRLGLGSAPKSSELMALRFRRGVAARQGRRPTMEDAHVACDALPPPPGCDAPLARGLCRHLSFYAVYDGHQGAEASGFCKVHLHRMMLASLAERVQKRRSGGGGGGGGGGGTEGDAEGGAEGDVEGDAEGDAEGDVEGDAESCQPTAEEVAAAMRDAFAATDEQFLTATNSSAGTTAIAAVVTRTHCIVANCGDSRGYLYRPAAGGGSGEEAPKEGTVLRMSIDHKPDRPDETARITAAGGWVSGGRVLHTLAVSRALGDRDFKLVPSRRSSEGAEDFKMPFKAPLVTHEAEVRIAAIQDGDELLLACDGLWDVLSGEKAFDFLRAHGASENPQRAVAQLCQAAEEQLHSQDNISAVYVRLQAPA